MTIGIGFCEGIKSASSFSIGYRKAAIGAAASSRRRDNTRGGGVRGDAGGFQPPFLRAEAMRWRAEEEWEGCQGALAAGLPFGSGGSCRLVDCVDEA